MVITNPNDSRLLGIIALLLLGEASSFVSLTAVRGPYASKLHSTSSSTLNDVVGQRMDINDEFKGLEAIHTNPDVFLIRDFLDEKYCTDLIEKAQVKKLDQSPVAYAGKTDDIKELVSLAAKGPVVWLSVVCAWLQVKDDATADQIQLLFHAGQNYIIFLLLAVAGITAFISSREGDLQALRTSTSTTLDNLDDDQSGTYQFVKRSAELFNPKKEKENPAKEAQFFEAPTVIRYEAGQSLAPHFDANRSAETEDANRGGQTLATLLLYLNNVEEGGKTRFGLLPSNDETGEEKNLTVRPKAGDALLFFPADSAGNFDDRLEHEGCAAVDTKWISRIWRHIDRVPPPFGLSNSALSKL